MSGSRSASPNRPPISASFLTVPVPASHSQSTQPSGTNTPTHSPVTQSFHMTVTLPKGDVIEGDFIYSYPGSMAQSPHQTSSLLASRHHLPQATGDQSDVLAAALNAALGIIGQRHDSDHGIDQQDDCVAHSPSKYAASLEEAERGEGEASPLIPPAAPSAPEQTPSYTAKFVHSVGSSIYYVITHPISTSLAILTSAPTALNALAAPSGKGPNELGAKWWNDMSGLNRAHSIANGGSSLLINTIMNALFLPTALHQFRTSITDLFRSVVDFLDNTFSIILAIGGAFAAMAIAYNAFLWLPSGVFSAIIPAALAFVVTLAQRYVGVKNVFRRIRNLFNEDAHTQQELADIIQHINPKYLEGIEARFKHKLTALLNGKAGKDPLTNNEYEQLLIELSQILSDLQAAHPDLINDTTTLEYITRYTGILFDITLALLIVAPPTLLTHMQKGYDGVNIVSQLTTNHPLPSMSTALKCLIGLAPGLASTLLYANSAMDIRTTLIDLATHLYQHPRGIPFALTLLIANVFASSGMENVAMGVVANPDNIARPYLRPGTPLATYYDIAQAKGGFDVNANASIKKGCLPPPPASITVTVKDMAKYAARTNERDFTKKSAASESTGSLLRKHSLFLNRRAQEDVQREHDQHVLQPSFM